MIQWLRPRHRIAAASLWGVIALSVALLARDLPSRAFFAGDSGVKLIAARNALSHPARPLDIDLPRVDGRAVEFVDPFFRIHGDHAHAMTSELFPALSAPFLMAFGLRGLFILPVLGFLLTLAAVVVLGRALDPDRSAALLLLLAVAATPFLFYALEFWEHMLAVGAASAATALLIRRRSSGWQLLAGALLGFSVLLRPEAVWFVAAVSIGSQMLTEPLAPRDLAVVLAGAAISYSPWVAYSLVHSGELLDSHIAGNLAGIGGGWGASRIAIARSWFSTPAPALLLACAATAVVAVVSATVRGRASSLRLMACGLALVVTVAAANRAFPPETLWCAAPVAVVAFAAPPTTSGGRRFLWTVTAAFSTLVWLTTPNDGGAQWGPRYLLFAFVPAAILVTDVLQETLRHWRAMGTIAVSALVAGNLLVQRQAYKELRGAKQTYERIVAFTERETRPGGYIVTDLWWFDQVTAALYPTRTMLFTPTPSSAHCAMKLLGDAHAADVSMVRSRDESSTVPLDRWLDDTHFRLAHHADLADRSVSVYHVERPHSWLRREPDDLAGAAVGEDVERAVRTFAHATNACVQSGQ